MFYDKALTEPAIRAVVGEMVKLAAPIIEHRGDLIKAIRSSIRQDVFTWDEQSSIYTLDMQRSYLKKRNRNRNVYYSAKELSEQNVTNGKYERLKQVSIIFIFENNTTPNTEPLAKIQMTDVNTKEVYFVNTQDTEFARRLVSRYVDAVTDDALLIEVEGSEKFMIKLTEQDLKEEREEGKSEGFIEAVVNIVKNLHISVTHAMKIMELPEQEKSRIIEALEKENISYAL